MSSANHFMIWRGPGCLLQIYLLLTILSISTAFHTHFLYKQATETNNAGTRLTRRGSSQLLAVASFFGPSKSDRESSKRKLLDAISPVQKGLAATKEQTEEILKLIEECERINPTKRPLKSKDINAKWELIYTTSDSILGKSRPAAFRAKGPIYQTIDTTTLSAKNEEKIAPLPFLSWQNAVTAKLTPRSESFVDVQFINFFVGPVKIQAPESARGALDTTYLDESMRISRGDKGNVFVLVK